MPASISQRVKPSRIVFSSDRDGNYEIYVINADGSNLARLTDNLKDDLKPWWSPDGTKIAFESKRDGGAALYVMNADGTNQSRLTNSPINDATCFFSWSPCHNPWSPGGTKIVFSTYRDGNGDIYVINADGSNLTRLTESPLNGLDPSWSPDGRKILFRSNRDGNYAIYVMNADGTNQARLTRAPPYASSSDYSWSPDSTKIVFSGRLQEDAGIYVINADGTNQTILLQNPDAWDPSWSPDGRKILFVGNRQIGVMNADGTKLTNLTNSDADCDNRSPSWSPDGKEIVFETLRNRPPPPGLIDVSGGCGSGPWKQERLIFIMKADGTNQRNLTNYSAKKAHWVR